MVSLLLWLDEQWLVLKYLFDLRFQKWFPKEPFHGSKEPFSEHFIQ